MHNTVPPVAVPNSPVSAGATVNLANFPGGYVLHTMPRLVLLDGKVQPSYTRLIGSESARCHMFRSPEEFAPHAHWLIMGCPVDELGRSQCECRYCSKGPQKPITTRLRAGACQLASQWKPLNLADGHHADQALPVSPAST